MDHIDTTHRSGPKQEHKHTKCNVPRYDDAYLYYTTRKQHLKLSS